MIKPFRKAVIAGWSSQVARRAHNPKVARFESRPRNQNFTGFRHRHLPLHTRRKCAPYYDADIRFDYGDVA